jgi:phospholipase C
MSNIETQPVDPIKHVILLLLENRSFDQMLGCFQQSYPNELDGIDLANPQSNLDDSGKPYPQRETREKQMDLDPHHELEHVAVQLEGNNEGFIRDFVKCYPTSSQEQREQIMAYYPLMFLDALHRMARDFTICDHWFSSLPGPTWPNRFFALSGTSSGRVTMPEGAKDPDLINKFFAQDQITIFDRLNEANRSWRVYFYDFPCSLILNRQRLLHNLANYSDINQFFREVRSEKDFPEFCLIEPKYAGVDQNDDHPPHNIMKGEKLIADVYNAIRSHDDLWKSSLIVILYDEHGGFYDHVRPPKAVPPDEKRDEYGFDRLGVRVPAVLVSPWVAKRVENTQFDHTSLLKYLIEKWDLGPLGSRTAAAKSVAIAITEKQPREDTLPFIRVPYGDLVPPRPDLEREDSSVHHRALDAFGEYLRSELDEAAAATIGQVARTAGVWIRFKHKVGKWLMASGTRLTADLQAHDQKRMEMLTRTILAMLGKKQNLPASTL